MNQAHGEPLVVDGPEVETIGEAGDEPAQLCTRFVVLLGRCWGCIGRGGGRLGLAHASQGKSVPIWCQSRLTLPGRADYSAYAR